MDREIHHDGAQLHLVVQEDPLGLRAVKLDVGMWAYPIDDEDEPPKVGCKVICVRDVDEDKLYWIDTELSRRPVL